MGVERLKEAKLPPPLKGVKVVEVGVWHAGPGGAGILADLGADVVKIENPGGDPERNAVQLGSVRLIPEKMRKPKSTWSLLYEYTNRGKRGICVDLKQEEGRKILGALVKDADIFVTNLPEDSKARVGIQYETLREINPKLIYVSFSGFGPKGPEKDARGFDPMAQGYSGLAFLTGGDEPKVIQIVFGDQLGAIAVSHAALAALAARDRQGHGQRVDVSLYGAMLWANAVNVLSTAVMGFNSNQPWERRRMGPTRNTWKCKDGKWIINTTVPEAIYWPQLCKIMGLEHLMTDPRYATPAQREANVEELVKVFDEKFLTKTRDEWMAIFKKEDLLFQVVQTMEDVVNHEQALANEYIVDVRHRYLGTQRWPADPYTFTRNGTVLGVAPEIGEHNDEVLSELGYAPDEIAALREKNIVSEAAGDDSAPADARNSKASGASSRG